MLRFGPKLFQNLRSTRQTELEETFPSHVVCSWTGNSEKIAKAHYLQVTDEHFERAVQPKAESAIRAESDDVQVAQNPTRSPAVTGSIEQNDKYTTKAESSKIPENSADYRSVHEQMIGRYWIRTSDFHRVKMAL